MKIIAYIFCFFCVACLSSGYSMEFDDQGMVELRRPLHVERIDYLDLVSKDLRHLDSDKTKKNITVGTSLIISSLGSIRTLFLSKSFAQFIGNKLHAHEGSSEEVFQYITGALSFAPNFALSNLSFMKLGDWLVDKRSNQLNRSYKYDKALNYAFNFLNIFSPLCTYYLCLDSIKSISDDLFYVVVVPSCIGTILINYRGFDGLMHQISKERDLNKSFAANDKRSRMIHSATNYLKRLPEGQGEANTLIESMGADSSFNSKIIDIVGNYLDTTNPVANLHQKPNYVSYAMGFIFGAAATYSTYELSKLGTKALLESADLDEHTKEGLSVFFASLSTVPWAILATEANQRVFKGIKRFCCDRKNILKNGVSWAIGGVSSIPVLYGAILATQNLSLGISIPVSAATFISSTALRVGAVSEQISRFFSFSKRKEQDPNLKHATSIVSRIIFNLESMPNEGIEFLYENISHIQATAIDDEGAKK